MRRTLIVATLAALGCTQPQPPTVTVRMTWTCAVPPQMDTRSDFARQDPTAKPVILYFTRYPNKYIFDNTPGLCDALTAAHHTEVPVVIQPHANPTGKYTGYQVLTIDGHTPGSGYGGGSGMTGNTPNPSLEELLR